jgi:hypothetical protein
MGVKQRMESATKMPMGTCASCIGRIGISEADFAEAAGLPDSEQLACLIGLAKQGAQTACQGCDVVGNGTYNKESKHGTIVCKGSDANGMIGNTGHVI